MEQYQSPFDDLPNEMYFEIFSYLDHRSILTSRSVSRKWKSIVEDSRNLKFSCHLTDTSISATINSQIEFRTVKVHDFTGNGNTVVSGTRGTGRVIRNARSIEIIGPNINPLELSRIMQFGMKTVIELVFERTLHPQIDSLISSRTAFSSLKKLTFAFNTFPLDWHASVFCKLAMQNRSERNQFLPCVSHLRILYEMDTIEELYSMGYVPFPHTMLNNYISIFRLIASLKRSLRIVEVLRNEVMRTALVLRVDMGDITVGVIHQRQLDACVRDLEGVNLEEIHLTPLMDEGEHPWILEGALLRHQSQLKAISINRKLCAPRPGAQNLTTLLPRVTTFYTTVKISMTCFGNAPVDLHVFSECPNLRTLWLAFYRGVRLGPARQNTLHFSNVEALPTKIQSLHFKSSQQDPIIIHQQSILQSNQVRWIIKNMKELESFWLQLVAEEMQEAVPPPLPQQPVAPIHEELFAIADEGEEARLDVENFLLEDGELQEAQNLVNQLNNQLNTHANINLTTFRELLSLPKIKELKLDMMKAEQLGAILEIGADGNPWILPMGIRVSVEDLRDYLQIITNEFPNFTCRTQAATFFPFGFIELTIKK